MQKLFEACKEGELKEVQKLVSQGVFPRLKNSKAVVIAAQYGHVEIVKYLHEVNADITTNCCEPLTRAAIQGHPEVVDYLLENGAIFNLTDNRIQNLTAVLLEACESGRGEGSAEVIRVLHEYGAEILDFRAIRKACSQGNFEAVKYLVAYGALLPLAEEKKSALLVEAAEKGHLEIVKCLHQNGVNVRDKAAIQRASYKQQRKVVDYLLQNGGDFRMLMPADKKYFKALKAWRRWRIAIYKRKLFTVALPLYYSKGFPGFLKGKKEVEEFAGEVSK